MNLDQDQYKALHTINLHAAEVVGLSLHATHDYVVSASLDHTWAFHNIETGKSLLQVSPSLPEVADPWLCPLHRLPPPESLLPSLQLSVCCRQSVLAQLACCPFVQPHEPIFFGTVLTVWF